LRGSNTAPEDVASEGPVEKRTGKSKGSLRKIKEKINTISQDADVQESLDEIKGKLESLAEDCENTAREHPFETIGACLFAGLVVGIIVGVVVGKKE